MDKKTSNFWTHQQRQQLIEAKKNGTPLKDLAKFHEVSTTTISLQIIKGERDQFVLAQKTRDEQWQRFKDINDNLFSLTNIAPAIYGRLDRTLMFMRSAVDFNPGYTYKSITQELEKFIDQRQGCFDRETTQNQRTHQKYAALAAYRFWTAITSCEKSNRKHDANRLYAKACLSPRKVVNHG